MAAVNSPIPKSHYYSGQGRLLVFERDANGNPIKGFPLANAPEVTVSTSVTEVTHKESQSGLRSTDAVFSTTRDATFTAVLESFSVRNMALFLWGVTKDTEGGTAASETIMLHKGAVVPLKHMGVSALVINKTTPTGVLADTNYDYDPQYGTIYVKEDAADVPAGGLACTANYSYKAQTSVEALTQVASPERLFRFEGLNTINNEPVVLTMHRVVVQPLTELGLISDEIAQYTITGTLLRDPFITGAGNSPFFKQTFANPLGL